jgi:hypothetical protein
MAEQDYMIQTTHRIRGQKNPERKHLAMSGETAAAPALALEIILPRLEIFCLPGQVCRFLSGDSDFRRLEFRCHQIAFVRDIAESRYHISASTNALSKAFDCPRSRVKVALEHEMDQPRQRGKHTTLDDDRERQIIDWIWQNAEQETPVKKTRDPGLLHNSIPDTNHSRLGKFIHSAPSW